MTRKNARTDFHECSEVLHGSCGWLPARHLGGSSSVPHLPRQWQCLFRLDCNSISALVSAGASLIPSPTIATFPFVLSLRIALSFRKYSCDRLVNTCLRADCFCSTLIVTCEHNNVYSHVLKFFYRSRTVFFDNISHCDNSINVPFWLKNSGVFPVRTNVLPDASFLQILRNTVRYSSSFHQELLRHLFYRKVHFRNCLKVRYFCQFFSLRLLYF